MAAYIFNPKWSWPFDPRTIGECKLWLDGTDAWNTLYTTGSNPAKTGYVTVWNDKSGYSNHASNISNRTNVTAYEYSPSNFYVKFDLASGFGDGFLESAIPAQSFSNGLTAFVVFTSSNLVSSQASILNRTTGGTTPAPFYFRGTSRTIGSSASNITLTSTVNINNRPSAFVNTIYSFTIGTRSGLNEYIDGSLAYSSNTTAYTYGDTASNVFIGAAGSSVVNGGFEGMIGEVLLYDGVLNDPNREFVEAYLSYKWSIAVSNTFEGTDLYTRTFLPIDIAGCEAWYDAADRSTITLGTGSNVATWIDKTSNGYNASAATNRPVYDSNSNCVVFTRASSQSLPISNSLYSSNFTVFVVEERTANTAGNYFLGGTSTTGNSNLTLGYLSNTVARMAFSPTNQLTATVPGYGIGPAINIWTFFYQPGLLNSRSITLNGSNLASDAPTSLAAWTNPTIGRSTSNYYQGKLFELIVYNQSLTTSQRARIQGYLAEKWNLKTNLTSNSAFKLFLSPASPVFTPLQISNIVAWFDGTDPLGNGTIPPNGTNVPSWTNKAVSGDAAVSSAGFINKPTYSSTYSGIQTNTAYYDQTTIIPGSQETVFIVHTLLTNPATRHTMISSGNGTTIKNRSYFINIADNYSFGLLQAANATPTGEWPSTVSSLPVSNTRLYEGSYVESTFSDGTVRVNINMNGNSNTVTSTISFSNVDAVTSIIGAEHNNTANFRGVLQEILMFDRVLSTIERKQIRKYLSEKWNIASFNTTDNPFEKVFPF